MLVDMGFYCFRIPVSPFGFNFFKLLYFNPKVLESDIALIASNP
jgi:hypothetical protein